MDRATEVKFNKEGARQNRSSFDVWFDENEFVELNSDEI